MTPPDLGCAVRPDGSLKEASEIDWTFDPDQETPPTAPALLTSEKTKVHPFFSGEAPPAASRRSGRATRPSNRIVDPNNVMGHASAAQPKQKAPNDSSACRVIQKRCAPVDEGELDSLESKSNSDSNHPALMQPTHEGSTDIEELEDTEAKQQQFASLKAMANADHEAIHTKSKEDATADVCTIFRWDREHKNPDTGLVQGRHWCKLCL
jgi:hypothetical protein